MSYSSQASWDHFMQLLLNIMRTNPYDSSDGSSVASRQDNPIWYLVNSLSKLSWYPNNGTSIPVIELWPLPGSTILPSVLNPKQIETVYLKSTPICFHLPTNMYTTSDKWESNSEGSSFINSVWRNKPDESLLIVFDVYADVITDGVTIGQPTYTVAIGDGDYSAEFGTIINIGNCTLTGGETFTYAGTIPYSIFMGEVIKLSEEAY